MDSIAKIKSQFRMAFRHRRALITPEARSLAEAAIGQLLESHLPPGPVGGYWAAGPEVSLQPWIGRQWEAGKAVALPRVAASKALEFRWTRAEDELSPGFRGILEPDPGRTRLADPSAFAAILIPGVGFDLTGGRLGQGGGYYDRLLLSLPKSVLKVGVGFEAQLAPAIPAGEGDAKVEVVVSESRWSVCRTR